MTGLNTAVTTMTEAEFNRFAPTSAVPVLVDFWAPWCSPCRFLAPLFEKFAREFGDKAIFVKINRDEAPNLRQRFEITSIPRLILFQQGKPVAVEVGMDECGRQHVRVKKMLGLNVLGRPTNRERKFRGMFAAAWANYNKMVAETRFAYYAEFTPIAMKVHADRKVNGENLAAGTINAAQHEARNAEIEAQFEASSSSIKHLFDAYNAVNKPAEILFRADVLDAADLLFPLGQPSATTSAESASGDGDFCAIGDSACGG